MKNHGPFVSMFWKDYRDLRAFWLATALMGVGIEAIWAYLLAHTNDTDFPTAPALFTIFLIPALYALGCAAAMFAGEHESGVYRLLQTLAIRPQRLLIGRTAFMLVSCLLMMGLIGAAFWTFSPTSIRTHHLSQIVASLTPLPIELFVWGVFFSLLTRRALIAAILGALLSVCLPMIFVINFSDLKIADPTFQWWSIAFPVRAIVIALVMAVNLRLVGRWFHDEGIFGRKGSFSEMFFLLPNRLANSDGPSYTTTKSTPEFGRLVWQHWRQSPRLLTCFFALSLMFAILAIPALYVGRDAVYAPIFSSFALLLPLSGIFVFREDWQENHFRFLTDHGAHPGRVWWSRQLVWFAGAPLIAIVFLFGLVLFAACVIPPGQLRWEEPFRLGGVHELLLLLRSLMGGIIPRIVLELITLIFAATIWIAVPFACGQFWSMHLRSSILAGFATWLTLVLLIMWCELLYMLRVPFWWTIWPIPVVLLVATRLRMRDWLLERTDWRARTRAVLIPVVPLVAILVAIPFYRVYSVPGGGPGFSVEELSRPNTPEEMATVRMYEKAHEASELSDKRDDDFVKWMDAVQFQRLQSDGKAAPITPEITAWIKKNRKAIEKTIQASRGKQCSFFEYDTDPNTIHISSGPVKELGNLVVASARKLTAEGDLDAALEHYLAAERISNHLRSSYRWPWLAHTLEYQVQDGLLAWAAQPDQTPERLRRALDEMTQLQEQSPSYGKIYGDNIKDAWSLAKKSMAEIDSWGMEQAHGEAKLFQFLFVQRFSWEKTRADRAIDYLAREDLARVKRVDTALREGRRVDDHSFEFSLSPFSHDLYESTYITYSSPSDREYLVRELVYPETHRRAFRLQMALAAWRLEHGEMPESLDALVAEGYLDAVPIDPYTGQAFRYFPKGISKSTLAAVLGTGHYSDRGISPFIWSPSLFVISFDENLFDYRQARNREGEKFTTEVNMILQGKIFRVPQSE